MYWDMMGGWGWLGAAIAVALLVLIVAAVIWLVRDLGAPRGRRRPGRDAIAELEMRYARGEVDRDPYLAIRRDLEQDDS